MGTEVLRPYDCLSERMIRVIPRRRNLYNNHQFQTSSKVTRSSKQSRRSPDPTATISRTEDLKSERNNNNNNNNKQLVMGQVTILRRGEKVDDTERINISRISEPSPSSKVMYAGSAFSVSPAPESLPLPSFSKKKLEVVDASATRDLRRLLRLE